MSTRTDRTPTVRGRTIVLLLTAAVCVGIALVAVSFLLLSAPSDTVTMSGSIYVNASGSADPLSQHPSTYNVTLVVSHGQGILNVTSASPGALPIAQDLHSVNVASLNATTLTMKLDGNAVKLVWVSNDSLWNHRFDGYYIASWGPAAPSSQIVGQIRPSVLPGLSASYYVELRLAVVQAQPPPPEF